jgi:AbrB family looped-hinge helix DNA binding protein
MEKELTTLSSKGQLVIPKLFRQKLGLKAGDFIGMMKYEDMIILKKVEVQTEKIETKVKKASDNKEFTFEELLYPDK